MTDTIECPQCGGSGVIVPGALAGHWSGLMPWTDDLVPEPCDLCHGEGEVDAHIYADYEAQFLED